jgi:hypothetical protein
MSQSYDKGDESEDSEEEDKKVLNNRWTQGDLIIVKFSYSPFGPFGAPKSSAFFLTINTNKKPANKIEEVTLIDWLQSGLEHTFSRENLPKALTDLTTGREPVLAVLGEVILKYGVEVGQKPKGGRVHAHSLLKIQHNTKLHINPGSVKSQLVEYFKGNDVPVLSLYVNVRAAKTEEAMLRYITKYGG